MRHWLIAPLLLSAAMPALAAPKTSLPLNDGWQVRIDPADGTAIAAHRREAQWLRATVPGSVQQDLIAAKRVPDPYQGTNEGAIQWAGLAGWQYRRTIEVTPAMLARDHLDLVFDGIDTFATVSLNGQLLLKTDNAHRRWRIAAKPALHAGRNELVVTIASPIRTLQPLVLNNPNPLPGEYESFFGDEPKGKQTSPYIRKPKYHYGWDWGPRIVSSGLWRPVRLEAWDEARIDSFRVEQDALNQAEARLSAKLDVVADAAVRTTVRATVTTPAGQAITVEQAVTLAAGHNAVSIPLTIADPQRWQPVGYGAQPLYRVDAALGADDNASRTIGLRTVELMRDGGGFGFRVNGTPIFAKGANLIPFDMFPARVTPERMRSILQGARDANMNMIRVWGGGYYLDDAFYDLADRMGLMVWQDFMFGGSVTPPDAAYRENVRIEADEQVSRLQSHPSIVLWAGNNEVLSGWENWSDRKAWKKAVGPDEQERIGTGMAVLFNQVLRDAVLTRSPGTPYWPGSPSANYEAPTDTDANGDRHFWDVWSGSKPVENYLDSCPRFMSEFGFQSMPNMSTIRGFAGPGALTAESPVMKAHQKFLAGAGNERLQMYLAERLRPARDFADMVYLTQVNQAQAITLGASHHRACRPVTMGSLYWQINDVWPSISWASIDYNGQWKLLHYAARRFFAPEAIVAEHRGAATRVVLVSDATTPTAAHWRLTGYDMGGRQLSTRDEAVTLAPLTATEVASVADDALFAGADAAASYGVAELVIDGKVASRTLVERRLPKDMAYPAPQLAARWHGRQVTITAGHLARAVMLDFGSVAAQPSDNGFDLLPGESVTIDVAAKASPATLAKALTLRTLAR